jgi:hypothetical protein
VTMSPSMLSRVLPSSTHPPRLLRKVKNGRGLETTLDYASMHDPLVVEQSPDESWFDGRPKATPNTQWVVATMRAFDVFAGTTSQSSYVYKNPRHGADDAGRYAFRGFEEVTTTSASNAKTVERYGFDVDWSGRLVETRVHPAEAPSEVRTITKQQWQAHYLFSNSVKAILPVVSESFTCANGQTVASCAPAAAGYTRTTTTHEALQSTKGGGPALAYVARLSLLEGPAPADGDRRTDTTYALVSDTSTYRLREISSVRAKRAGAQWLTFAKTASEWDPTYRVALTDEVWVDNDDSHRAITRSVFDMTTGNLVERWKPNQQSGGPKTAFDYDSRKLFVDLEINELGHQVEYVYEYGTGTKLETLGPNTAGSTKERHRIRVDGVGRTIEEHESISLTGASYATVARIGTTTYVEANLAATPPTPASVQSNRLIQYPGTASTQEKTELDGHGRPIKKTVFVQGSAPANHVTTFSYRNDGTLQPRAPHLDPSPRRTDQQERRRHRVRRRHQDSDRGRRRCRRPDRVDEDDQRSLRTPDRGPREDRR